MKERCPHLFADRDRIRRSITQRKKKDISSCSATCDVSGDLWCCLQCGHIGCGRSSKGHAKIHFLDTGHQVAMEVVSGSCFCYECDMFISREEFLAKVSSVFTFIQKTMGVENIQHFSPKKKRINLDPLSRKKRRTMMASMNEAEEGEKKAGLVNMSNTCFMNSVIQSLLFTPIFSHHFLSQKDLGAVVAEGSAGVGGGLSKVAGPTTRSSSRIEKSNFGGNQETVNPINVELAQLFLTLRSGKVSLVEPESLYNSICKSLPAFYGFQQHDAQEFLRYFLDEIHKELEGNSDHFPPSSSSLSSISLPSPPSSSAEKEEENIEEKQQKKIDSDFTESVKDLEVLEASSSFPISSQPTPTPILPTSAVAPTKSKSIVPETFQGSLLSEIKCPLCGKISRKFDPFMDLSIHIPHKFVPKSRSQTLRCTLEECLDSFVGPETLCSKDYSCLSCASSEPPMKQFTIHSSPNVLCLHIKRFRWPNRSKITTFVEFREALDLRDFMKVPEPSPYYLFSVICHTGYGTWAGHYTSYCLSKEGEWYLYDDDVVSKASWEEVKEAEAYVLFYAKGEFKGRE